MEKSPDEGDKKSPPPDKGGQGGCITSREGCPLYPLKNPSSLGIDHRRHSGLEPE